MEVWISTKLCLCHALHGSHHIVCEWSLAHVLAQYDRREFTTVNKHSLSLFFVYDMSNCLLDLYFYCQCTSLVHQNYENKGNRNELQSIGCSDVPLFYGERFPKLLLGISDRIPSIQNNSKRNCQGCRHELCARHIRQKRYRTQVREKANFRPCNRQIRFMITSLQIQI